MGLRIFGYSDDNVDIEGDHHDEIGAARLPTRTRSAEVAMTRALPAGSARLDANGRIVTLNGIAPKRKRTAATHHANAYASLPRCPVRS